MRIACIGLTDPGYSEPLAGRAHKAAVAHLRTSVKDVVDAGLQPDEERGAPAIDRLVKAHADKPFDALFIMQVAWARPGVLLQVIRAFPHLPMVLYAPGSPWSGKGPLTSIAPAAGAGGSLNVLRRHGVAHRYVWSAPGKPVAPESWMPFARAAHARRQLRGTKLGMVGFSDMRLQTTGFDVQEVHERLGVEIESVDMLQVQQWMERVSSADISRRAKKLETELAWHAGKHAPAEPWHKVIAFTIAMERWMAQGGFSGCSIKCPTGVAAAMGITPCLVGSLLARKYHFICENDIPGLLGQTILGLISGEMSAYWEYYEVYDDSLLLGCCGFSPECFLRGKYTLRTIEGFMTGMGCCSSIKEGDYTVARLGKDVSGAYVLQHTQGRAVKPAEWYEDAVGAPMHPSVRFYPQAPVDRFMRSIMAQHVAVVPGRWCEAVSEFAAMTGTREA